MSPRDRLRKLTERERQALFETRTERWHEVGLGAQVDRIEARRARNRAVILFVLFAAVLVALIERSSIFPDGSGKTVKIVAAVLMAVIGWGLAQTLATWVAPALFRRMEPGVAGTVGFLIRLVTVVIVVVVSLRIAGVKPETLAVGGAFTAVVLGLAAQQTLGNLIAGIVLLSTSPFRVGDRIVLQGGQLAGTVEGVVGSLGLFYTTVVAGADRTMVPNSVVMSVAVKPVQEPDRVELRAIFEATVTPDDLQKKLEGAITVPLRRPPEIRLEELDRDRVTLSIVASPLTSSDGAALATQILDGVRVSNGVTDEHELTGSA